MDFGEDENSKFIKVKVTPNPNTGIFTIEMSYAHKTIADITIFDSIRREICTYENEPIDKYNYYEIDMNNYAREIYFIKIRSLDYTRIYSFIITR